MVKVPLIDMICGIVSVFMIASLPGCDGGGLALVPVKGIVTVNGDSIGEVGVSFRADSAKGNTTTHIPTATADDDGNYELITGGEKGAPPGWYKVIVTPPSLPITGGEMPATPPTPFDKKYLDPGATDLSIEVKAGAEPGAYDLQLKK